jgi:hypothetical protein
MSVCVCVMMRLTPHCTRNIPRVSERATVPVASLLTLVLDHAPIWTKIFR